MERNKLSDHSNYILVVRIDSTTCDRNMKENYYGVQNRVERSNGDGLLTALKSSQNLQYRLQEEARLDSLAQQTLSNSENY